MKVLIAGGAGYVGTRLARNLLKQKCDVTVIDLCWFGDNLPQWGVRLINKNLFDVTVDDLKGFDQVIFLGGLSNDPMAELDTSLNFVYNTGLPIFLAYQSKKAGVKRFIYGSSCSVYGNSAQESCLEDSSKVSSPYPYGASKFQGESGVMQMADDNFSVISLRKGTVGGWSPRMRFDLIVNTMYKFAITQNKITVNNPSIWRPIIDIRDVVEAYTKCVFCDESINEVFNIANKNYTVIEIAELIQKELLKITGKKINIDIRNVEDFRNYKVDTSKAQELLGFYPSYEVGDTIAELHENRSQYGDFKNEKFYNIKVFSSIIKDLK